MSKASSHASRSVHSFSCVSTPLRGKLLRDCAGSPAIHEKRADASDQRRFFLHNFGNTMPLRQRYPPKSANFLTVQGTKVRIWPIKNAAIGITASLTNTLSPMNAARAIMRHRRFDFTLTLNGATGTYTYIGHGMPGGTIASGDTISLAHGQSITFCHRR